jgi:hypothetical protein
MKVTFKLPSALFILCKDSKLILIEQGLVTKKIKKKNKYFRLFVS